jgi:hypothetical protein
LSQRAESGHGSIEIALSTRYLNAAQAHEWAIGMFGNRHERACGSRDITSGKLLGHEVQTGGLEGGVKLERALKIRHCAAAIGHTAPGFAPIHVGHWIRRFELYEMLSGIQTLAVPASGIVPRREVPPTQNERRLFGYKLPHDRDSLGAIAAAILDPGRARPEFDRKWIEIGWTTRNQRLIEPTGQG